ncbi:MAG: hypothetical protein GY898_08290 [Proteobacteria bacterium]|nr:hypothetical protein [Pseudomonadota bacterium]
MRRLLLLPAFLLLVGCGEALSPLDQTTDFGAIHLTGEYVEVVTLTNQLFVEQTIQSASFADGSAFELLTLMPIVMDPEASYGLEFRFVTGEAGSFSDVVTLQVTQGDNTYNATVRLEASFENGDLDGDGFVTDALGGTDCDDTDPLVHVGAEEICDGVDSNCNGETPENEVDEDGDGWFRCGGDCDDQDDEQHPERDEGCDFKDSDCDGFLGDDELDLDNDGYSACDGDCEPENEAAHPGPHAEVCDGIDTNCDGFIPPVEDDCE